MAQVRLGLGPAADGVPLGRALNPRPASCGKMYHIQCDRFRPARTSASAVA
ncbi:MAG: hypothetical protein U0736_27485 [Gemmataceae bacterium]